MNKLTMWLGVALAVQLMIAGGLYAAGKHASADNAAQPLLAFDRDKVDRVVISADDASVTLTKAEGKWQIDGAKKLPVAENKLDGILDQVKDAKAGWPVAKTGSSRERLEVADDKYQKHLQLYSGDKLVSDLYVGTSPGFRKVHVRRAGEDDVYAIQLNAYDLTPRSDDWLDKDVLKMEDIKQIQGSDFSLKNTDDAWAFVNTDNEAPLELDKDKANQLASAISGLRVQGVADQPLGEKATEITVTGADGEKKYQFAEKGKTYMVTRNDIDAVFTLSKYDYERITKFNRNQLAKQHATAEEETEENS